MVSNLELQDAAELGAVDDRSVRVWIRAPGRASASARLEVEGAAPIELDVPLRAEDDWINAAHLALPAPVPGARFVCIVGERRLAGRLAPTAGDRASFTFAFGSCNQLLEERGKGRVVVSPAASIFPRMLQELRAADARFVLYIGDQIYSEVPEALSVWDRRAKALARGGQSDELVEAYRRLYRIVFGHPDVRAIREAFPTYCMWDDHELFDDWGSRHAPQALAGTLFAAASRTYCEYQHLRNPGGAIGSPPYHYTFRHGDVGFLVLDSRGERSHPNSHAFGPAQWAAIDEILAPGLTPPIESLFVVLTVPIAHVATWFVRLAQHTGFGIGPAARDRWNSWAFHFERNRLLRRLLEWQQGAPRRQVILLSGDVHAANVFSIRSRRAPGVIRQLTSSPLTTPIPPTLRALTPVIVRGANLFEPEFRFRRHYVATRHNFGLVRVEPLDAGGHRVQFDLHPGPMARFAFEPDRTSP
jgi:phosphodiesterase/alkaline phosphatase D-like protein